MDDIARYLAIRSANGATLPDTGDELAFLLDTTGHPEIWTTSAPNEWPTQRTFGSDPVRFCTYAPDRDTIVFGRDTGGDERVQFFRLDLPDGAIAALTNRPAAKHYWGGWANDSARFAFSSNRRDEAVFDIYVQSVDEATATLVHESDTWLVPRGFAPDDERLIVREVRASYDTDLYICDIDSGSLEQITHDTGDVRFRSPQWSPDGDAVYCLTDAGADTLYLARIDCADHTLEVVEQGGDWNVDGLSIDTDTGRMVYSRNVGGQTHLTAGVLANPLTIDPLPQPGLPDGVAGGVSFDAGADRWAITHTSRTSNTAVFVVEMETGEAERWTHPSTAGIPPGTFRGPEIVSIPSFDDLEVPGLLTLPAETHPDSTPVIVDIHGGPQSQRRPSFHRVHQYFLANGYAIFEPNVRGSSGYGKRYTRLDDVEKRMDSVADLAACVQWLREHDAIDPDRIVAKGGSYGGFMVLAAMTEYPDLWAAGIDIVGIANFVTFLENTGSWRREHREAEYGALDEDRAFLTEISPLTNIDRIRAPLFVIHGANDPRVPVEEAEQIAAAAANHVPVETLIFEDEGHGIVKLENRIRAYSRMVAFLDDHL